ncbi:hypothetical protein, partial [Vibrio cholerae]|uniref:hypothetical protein n=1 Tax=Vibrio cholerae TaxID=666 RepID=UPI00197F7996
KRLIAALNDIAANEKGVNAPSQIGRAHIHRYYTRHQGLSSTTLRDHFYAFRLLLGHFTIAQAATDLD